MNKVPAVFLALLTMGAAVLFVMGVWLFITEIFVYKHFHLKMLFLVMLDAFILWGGILWLDRAIKYARARNTDTESTKP